MKLLSKFFRVAVEGDTIDGREISREQIQQMADSYDPNRYGARVWPEHFRGIIPGGPFDALGDVVTAKAEEVSDVPALKGKLGLYVQIQPTDKLLTMNQAKQKVYSSIEVISNFAKSGQAYLVGLAVTDTPASQGTELMAFSAGEHDVFAGADHETAIEFIDDEGGKTKANEETGKPSLFNKVTALLGRKSKVDEERFGDIDQSVELLAESQQGVLEKLSQQDARGTALAKSYDDLKKQYEQLSDDFKALKDSLEKQTSTNYTARPDATGGDGAQVTDC